MSGTELKQILNAAGVNFTQVARMLDLIFALQRHFSLPPYTATTLQKKSPQSEDMHVLRGIKTEATFR